MHLARNSITLFSRLWPRPSSPRRPGPTTRRPLMTRLLFAKTGLPSNGQCAYILAESRDQHNYSVWFRPRILRDVTSVDWSTTILGQKSSLPVYISATALGKLGHPDGELNLTRAAGKHGVIQMVSTRLQDPTFRASVRINVDTSHRSPLSHRAPSTKYSTLLSQDNHSSCNCKKAPTRILSHTKLIHSSSQLC